MIATPDSCKYGIYHSFCITYLQSISTYHGCIHTYVNASIPTLEWSYLFDLYEMGCQYVHDEDNYEDERLERELLCHGLLFSYYLSMI